MLRRSFAQPLRPLAERSTRQNFRKARHRIPPVPPGFNERSVETAGLSLIRCEDRTLTVAEIAKRWHTARLPARLNSPNYKRVSTGSSSGRIFLATTAELAAEPLTHALCR